MSAPIPVFSDRPKAAPTPKLRALVKYPGNIVGGTGIDVTKEHGTVTVDMQWNEFGLQSAIPTSPTNNILTFDTATEQYVMIPSSLLGGAVAGIADAPIDGTQYARNSGAWTHVPLGTAVNVKDYGATGNGSGTNDETARVAAEAASSSVYFPTGNYVLTNPPTLGKSWGPGICTVSGVRVYLHPYPGAVDAIYMAGFGLPLSSGDSSPLVQAAIDLGQERNIKVIAPPGASMRFDSTVTIKQGWSLSDTHVYELDLDMNGTTVAPSMADYVFAVEPRCLIADGNTGRQYGNVDIRNLKTTTFLNANCKAIHYGRSGYGMYGYRNSVLENCTFLASAADALLFECCGKILINNVTGVSGCGLQIQALNDGEFCGDLIFTGCQFHGHVGDTVIPAFGIISHSSTGGRSRIGGVKFLDCYFYGPGNYISIDGNGEVGTLSFTDTGITYEDNPSLTSPGIGLEILCNSGGNLFNLFFTNVVMGGFGQPAIYLHAESGAQISDIRICGGVFGPTNTLANGSIPAVICFQGAQCVHVTGAGFGGNAVGGYCVLFNNCTEFSAVNNTSEYNNTTYGIGIVNTCDYYIVTNNRMECTTNAVLDSSAGAHTVVTQNLTVPVLTP